MSVRCDHPREFSHEKEHLMTLTDVSITRAEVITRVK